MKRIPNREVRDGAAWLRQVSQDPPYGVTLGGVLQHLVNAFPGIDVEPVRGSATQSWYVPEQVLTAIRVAIPHVTNDEIIEYFSVCRFPARGALGEAITCLFEERKVRVAEFHAIKHGFSEGPCGPLLRFADDQPCSREAAMDAPAETAGFYSARDLASRHAIVKERLESFRKMLGRWRARNLLALTGSSVTYGRPENRDTCTRKVL